MNAVKLALVGVGEVAQNFHLPIYSKLNNVSLEGVYDKITSKARAIADKYEIRNVYSSFEDLLKNEEISTIDICTSTDKHFEYAIQAIENNKNVIIEKPIAKNYQEAKLILEASEKYGTKVMVASNHRFRYDAMVLKNFVQTGELGDIYYIRGTWNQHRYGNEWRQQKETSGGGVLMDLGVSLIDSLLWISNFPQVISASASMFKQNTSEVEDICIANIKFDNGMMVNLEISWSLLSVHNTFGFDIYGSNGVAKINPLQLFKNDGNILTPITSIDTLSNIATHKKSFESQLKHFINGILGLHPIISSPYEAIQTMKIIDMLYRSASENKPILSNE
ncbi:MAG TPA: Gfo/Idh/MocA family oxidoreductase [Candidatus Kapabacteria bacterium]|nr:Gfo/Idh/MocA family oxidoreductase [Candidatus Kapabacteria bacterium]